MMSKKQQELLDEENPLQIYGGGFPCWGNKTIEDIQKILDEPSIQLPSGLTREEMREFILRSVE
jgi:hypothetical protein